MFAELPVTQVVNHLLAGPVNAGLNALGMPAANPEAPIPTSVAVQIVVLALLVAIFLILRSRLSVENPKPLQHIIEGAARLYSGSEPGNYRPSYRALHPVFAGAVPLYPVCQPDRAGPGI